jgi:hypothetical protein
MLSAPSYVVNSFSRLLLRIRNASEHAVFVFVLFANFTVYKLKKKKNSAALACKRITLTERPPLVVEVDAIFCG